MSTLDAERRTSSKAGDGVIRSLIPARLDRLGWSRFHTMLVVALGVAWVLDGLEITIASNVTALVSKPQALNLSSSEVAFAVGTVYLLGEVFGALFFGRLSDKWGRRNLFMITLGVYLFGGLMSALTFGHTHFWVYWLWASRFIAGAGIGGEYAAINSAIDELIPAKYRGRVDIAVNGTYWAGALIATVLTILVVDKLPVSYGWRVGFLFGPALGFIILFVRKNLPESPRWLLMHGREKEAEAAVEQIEEATKSSGGTLGEIDESKAIEITPATNIGFITLARTLFVRYPKRSILGATLMITQSFLYNAIFFTYALVLTKIYTVPATDTAYYFIFFAAGNLIGPLTLGHLFDTIGRRVMIAGTYLLAGSLLVISALMFDAGVAQCGHPDGLLVRDLLLCLGRRQRRLPDGERDLPGGGAGQGHRRLLRHRPVLRRPGTLALRLPDRQRPGPLPALHRLSHRGRGDDDRRPGRGLPRGQRRGEVAGGRGEPALFDLPTVAPPLQRDRRPSPAGGPDGLVVAGPAEDGITAFSVAGQRTGRAPPPGSGAGDCSWSWRLGSAPRPTNRGSLIGDGQPDGGRRTGGGTRCSEPSTPCSTSSGRCSSSSCSSSGSS